MNPYNFSLLFFSFSTFLISLLIWLKRQDKIGKAYFIFSCLVTVWGMFFSIMISNASHDTALLSARMNNAIGVWIPVAWFRFLLIYLNKQKEYKNLQIALYIATAIVFMFSPTQYYVSDVKPIWKFAYYAKAGSAFMGFTLLFFTVVPYSFYLLARIITKTESPTERKQLLGFMLATGSGFLGAAPAFFLVYDLAVPQYGLFLMPLYPFLMAYVMMRKGLFDEEAIIQAARKEKLAAIGTLAASINHEIKNPLYIIQGSGQSFLSNLSDGIYETPEQGIQTATEVLTKVTHQATRAIDIMRKFSMFAKQDLQQTAEISKVSFGELFDGVLPLVKHEFSRCKICVEADIPEDLPLLRVDARHMEEILFNLMINAFQAMKPQGGGTIRITAGYDSAVIKIRIKDTGPGIPKENLKKIFDPFYTTKSEGTGLGLYITKQLVERNGGKIEIESHSRETSFVLEFSL
jgi:signal transduction histidine kinase